MALGYFSALPYPFHYKLASLHYYIKLYYICQVNFNLVSFNLVFYNNIWFHQSINVKLCQMPSLYQKLKYIPVKIDMPC